MHLRLHLMLVIAGLALTTSARASVRYVDDDATPGGDGTTWEAAYVLLQDALAEAEAAGGAIAEIHLAAGRYTPDQGAGQTAGDRLASFVPVDGVTLRGGYLGLGAEKGEDPDARDIEANPSILSGDLAGDDGPAFTGRGENSYHVVHAINIGSDAAFDGVTITAGYADGPSSHETGAGVLLLRASPGFVDCVISDNFAVFQGGGMQAKEGSSPEMTRCTFTGNRVLDNGGAIYNGDSRPRYTDCSFINNTARIYAAGVCNRDGSEALFVRCVFIGNASAETQEFGGGGAAVVNAQSDAIYFNCTFFDNHAPFGKGGALVNEQGFDPKSGGSSAIVTNCTFQNNSAGFGGAMYNIASDPEMVGCVFDGNLGGTGGAIYSIERSEPSFLRCDFRNNSASTGGAMFSNDSDPVIIDSTFTGNEGTGQGGGAIWNQGGRATITGCTFDANRGTRGGGVYNGAESSPTISFCVFIDNVCQDDGGGVSNDSSAPFIHDCQFINNTAFDGEFTAGGGMSNYFSTVVVTGCTFIANTAYRGSFVGGGGMYLEAEFDGKSAVANCTFIDNGAEVGGGLYNFRASPAVTNCVFAQNVADTTAFSVGGGIYNNFQSNPAIVNCTFAANDAETSGGAVYDFASSPRIANSILWGNTPDQVIEDQSSATEIMYSTIEDGWAGLGVHNAQVDPMFVEAGGGNYRLQPGSPCIDAGHNWLVPADDLDLDLDGDRTELVPLDVEGAPRFADDEAVPTTGCGGGVFVIDLGAYEAPGSSLAALRPADLDGNGVIDVADIVVLLGHWGPCKDDCCPGDINVDAIVDVDDVVRVIADWG